MSISNAIVTIDNTEPYLLLDQTNTIKFYVSNYTVTTLPSVKLLLRDAVTGKTIFSSSWKGLTVPTIFSVTEVSGQNIATTYDTVDISGPFQFSFSFTEIDIESKINTQNPMIMCIAISDSLNTSPYSNGVLKNVIKKGTPSGKIKGETERDIDILYPNNFQTFEFEYNIESNNSDSLLMADFTLQMGSTVLQTESCNFGKNVVTWSIPIKARFLEEIIQMNPVPSSVTINIRVDFSTVKGYVGYYNYSKTIAINASELFNNSFYFQSIMITPDENKGCNKVQITLRANKDVNKSFAGNLQLFRKDLTSTKGWELVHEIVTNFEVSSNDILVNLEDIIAEPGKPYLYAAYCYHRYFDGVAQSWITEYLQSTVTSTEPTILVTNDIFLVTKNNILRIAYNPELTGFKQNMVDQITTTIGGAYPFITRNGMQKHKTFTLGGLLSYNREITQLYSAEEISKNDSTATTSVISTISQSSTMGEFINESYYQNIASKAAREAIYEKEFRNIAMNFLYSDDIILFKSLQEGNIILRLTSVTMNPNAQLNRDVYSFSSQAVEVMESSVENCYEYFVFHADEKAVVYKDLYLIVKEYGDAAAIVENKKSIILDEKTRRGTLLAYQINKGV